MYNLLDRNADLIWFDYETKMRKLVSELLEPSTKRSIQDRELYDALIKKYDEQAKKLEELEFIVCKSKKRQTVFEDINQRINELVYKIFDIEILKTLG